MKISIKFSLAKAKTEELPIRMRISYDGLRLDVRTGFVCHPDKFDSATGRVRPGAVNRYHESSAIINRSLAKFEDTIIEILTRYELEHALPTPDVLKRDFEKALGRTSRSKKDPDKNLPELFRKYIIMHGKEASLSNGTISSYTNLRERLLNMPVVSTKAPDDLTTADLSEFVNQLMEDDIENQTIYDYLAKIRAVLRWSRKLKLYSGTLPEDFHPKLKGIGKKDIHYLDWKEFEQILYCHLRNDNHIPMRDAFCLCCATGLRISDCLRLKWQNIHLTSEVPYLEVVTKKTTKPLIIELNKWSRAIIDRQKIHEPEDTLFPKINAKSMNDALPQIAKEAGIKGTVRELSFVGNKVTETIVPKADAISTHWGRHTFIVHALHLGISPNVIMAWTGHSSYESMKPYIAIADETRIEKMSLFDK